MNNAAQRGTKQGVLTTAELACLDRNGYVVREDVFTPAEVADIAAACEDLVARLVRERQLRRYKAGSYVFAPDYQRNLMIKWEGDTDIVHGIEPFAHLDPALNKWAHDARFTEPMQAFVGAPNPSLFTEKLNLKRPGIGGVNPLHQDYPYWVGEAEAPDRVATAMLLLDDSTLENGCLQVVPGSHRSGQWRKRTDTDEFGSNEIDAKSYTAVDLQPLPLRAGSMVMFGSLLVHASEQNRSALQRRALLFSYQPNGHRTMVDNMNLAAERYRREKAERAAQAAR
jgi:phytanoyl-CoA hydroxylase